MNKKQIIKKKIARNGERLSNKTIINDKYVIKKNNMEHGGNKKIKLLKHNDVKKNKVTTYENNYINYSIETKKKNTRFDKINTELFSESFKKKNNIDYDVIIIISSYDRLKNIKNILNQLRTQKTKYTYRVILLNDGSNDMGYNDLVNTYNIDYISNKKNNGKKEYWKSINYLFSRASNYKSHTILQIDDDFLLGESFLDRLMDGFFYIKKIDNRYVAISYHLYGKKHTTMKRWGFDYWIDGGGLYDSLFISAIDYKINEINKERWEIHSNVSSGVWEQMSFIINRIGCRVYKLGYSLVFHDDENNSKMNYRIRKQTPLNTYNFKKIENK